MSKPDLAAYPVRMDRRGLAAFITKEFFPVSPRSLEKWPLTWQHVNNKAVGLTAEADAGRQAGRSTSHHCRSRVTKPAGYDPRWPK